MPKVNVHAFGVVNLKNRLRAESAFLNFSPTTTLVISTEGRNL
jgi:hypothetical protein